MLRLAVGALLLSAVSVAAAESTRSTADRLRDQTSRPAEVLAFLGLAPGMTALDLFAGDGYYSEVMAEVVGPAGRVYLHNNLGSSKSLARLQQRLAGDRLPNVIPLLQEPDQLLLRPESLDLVLLVKVYHDFYYSGHGWQVTADPVLTTLHRLLKPGATLGIIDHTALPGSGAAAAQSLHRIDPRFVCEDMRRQGFEFVGASDLLANPEDPLTGSVFEPGIQGRTSRFVHRYRKPAQAAPITPPAGCDRSAGN